MRRLLLIPFLTCACTYANDPDLRPGAADVFRVLRTVPEAGQRQVARDAPIDITFDGPPAGETITDVDLRVFSGLIEAVGLVRVDLLERRARFIAFVPLRAELRHAVYLDGGARGLNGARLSETVVFDFTTGSDLAPAPLPPPPAPRAAELQPLWSARCGGCHAGPESRAGVDLSTVEAALASLRAAPSAGSPLPRVQPKDHARSYLMRKLLGLGISGTPMPASGPPLDATELRRVADWIDGGATE